MSKLYVAYGSNLHLGQMAHRCPYASIRGTGILNNWELIFRGITDNSYATIRKQKGSHVPVLLWEITEFDERKLDIYEGYPRFYYKKNVMVETPCGKKKAMVYIMNDMAKPGKPSAYYIDTIITGYMQNHLDLNYIHNAIAANQTECQ